MEYPKALTLDEIREISSTLEELSKKFGHTPVWAILTALRGPDSMSEDLKYRTTAVIRRVVTPWLNPSSVTVAPADVPFRVRQGDAISKPGNRHFMQHVVAAARVLGLTESPLVSEDGMGKSYNDLFGTNEIDPGPDERDDGF